MATPMAHFRRLIKHRIEFRKGRNEYVVEGGGGTEGVFVPTAKG